MQPDQQEFVQSSYDTALRLQACGDAITNKKAPPNGCNYVQIAQGNTCISPAVIATINGATVGPVTTKRQDITVDFPAGPSTGFAAWKSIHGPFYENSVSAPFGDPNFDGSYLKVSVLPTPTPKFSVSFGWSGRDTGAMKAAPGGELTFTGFAEISGVDPASCYYKTFDLSDVNANFGTLNTQIDSGRARIDVLTGFIGDLSTAREPDFFGIREAGSNSLLQRVRSNGKAFESTASTYVCSTAPTYSVLHRGTASNIELIAAPNAIKHRCFITGISGDWRATRANGTVQPYAEIYELSNSWRLRVAPTSGSDSVYAEASCIQLRP